MSKDQKYTSQKGNQYEIKGGVHTGYVFIKEGEKPNILGFDNPHEAKCYIEERENGNRHFMDNSEEED